jgi:RNA polymerase sigma factor (sigma-70 family)
LPNIDRKNFVATIAAQYGRRLRRFLSVRLRNVHDVPDVAQEVFLRLLRVERQDAIRNPEAYLFTVASHVLQQHTLRRSSDPIFVDITDAVCELTGPLGDDPAAKVDNAERIANLERALDQLPPKAAAALVMHRVGGYTVQEIADQLGIGRESAKKYLMRAAQHCRKGRVIRALSSSRDTAP